MENTPPSIEDLDTDPPSLEERDTDPPDLEDLDTARVRTGHESESVPLPEVTLDPGEQIGPFVIVRRVGEGGMGQVYLAQDSKSGQQVALKILSFLAESTPELRERFEREGSVLARLRHPNVLGLIARGKDPRSGQLYLATEYIEGRDLLALLGKLPGHRLSIPEALFVTERCARGLEAAHAAGILHRDLKLSNVLVTRDGQVKLIDFGIALSRDDSARLTARGELMGTLSYIAPELVLDRQDWSPAADLFALGVLSFRLLTGRPPFPFKSLPMYIRAHKSGETPSVRKYIPNVPDQVEALISLLLARDPLDRPLAAELITELQTLGVAETTRRVALEWSQGRIGENRFPTAEASAVYHSQVDGGDMAAVPAQPTSIETASLSESQEVTFSGRKVGVYEFVRPLGKGAMGEVYLVRHPELDQLYALKVMLPEMANDPDAGARFHREMEIMAAVDAHPGIVRVHSAGSTANGRPYYAMEYVEGTTLHQLLKTGAYPRERALDLVAQVASALAFAHERNLIHRDIKPENVMVTPAGAARLTDFGLAKALELTAQRRLTLTGDLVGTPAYMAPEQANEAIGATGPWTDVFGLGAILYQIYAGVPPYMAETAIQIYSTLAEGRAAPRLRTRCPDVDPQIEAVIMRAIAVKPEKRYQSANELLQAMRTAREEPQAPPSPIVRYLLPTALASAVLALLVVVGASLLVEPKVKFPPADLRRLAGLLEQREHAQVLRQGEELIARFASADPPLPELDEVRELVARARGGVADERYAKGDLAGALEALEAGGVSSSSAHWILALNGDHVGALAALPSDFPPHQRARIAAWAGDRAAFDAATEAVQPEARARALRWRLLPSLPGDPPPLGDPSGPPDGWACIARGEEALARGRLGLAALDFAQADRSAPERDVAYAASMGLLRTNVARGDFKAAVKHWKNAWEKVEQADPLVRGQTLGWGAFLVVCQGAPIREINAVSGDRDVFTAAKRVAPGLPRVRLALQNRSITKKLTVDANAPPPALLLSRARTARRRGDLAGALSLVKSADPSLGEGCFADHERTLLLAGRDGAGGQLVARALQLTESAELGGSRPEASRALEALAVAARARPASPTVWIATARAALLARELDLAEKAARSARKAAPKGPRALLLAARVRAGKLESDLKETLEPISRLTPNKKLHENLAAGMEEVATACRKALAAAEADGGPGGPAAHEARVWLAYSLLQRARHLVWAGQARIRENPPPELAEAVAVTEPVLAGLDLDTLRLRRRELVEALVTGERAPIEAAEKKLAEAANAIPAARRHFALQALFLRATSGVKAAIRPNAEAYFALAGDVPARPILALRRSEAQSGDAQLGHISHGLALDPGSPQLLLAREWRKLDRGTADGETYLAFGQVLDRVPEYTDLVLTSLGAHRPASLEGALPSAHPDPAVLHLSRALAYLTVESDQPVPQAKRAVSEAAEAVAHRPHGAGAHLVRALALGKLSERVKQQNDALDTELKHALECALSAAPWADVVQRTRLHLGRSEEWEAALDVLLASGWLRDRPNLTRRIGGGPAVAKTRIAIHKLLAPVSDSIEKTDPENKSQTIQLARQLEDIAKAYPRLALIMRLRAGSTSKEGGALERQLAALSEQNTELRFGLEAQFQYHQRRLSSTRRGAGVTGSYRLAASLAARAVLEGGPAGGTPAPTRYLLEQRWILPTLPAKGRQELERTRPKLRSLFLESEVRARTPYFYLCRGFARSGGDSDRHMLATSTSFNPWGKLSAFLAHPRSELTGARFLNWWVDDHEWDEARLLLDRVSAFSLRFTSSSRFVYLAFNELQNYAWNAKDEDLERTWRMVGGLAESGLALTPEDHERERTGLQALRVDALLFEAGRAKGAEQRRLLDRAQSESEHVDRDQLDDANYESDYRIDWRIARLAAARGDVKATREALRRVKDGIDRSSRRRRYLLRGMTKDPLRPLLEKVPAYRAAFIDLTEAVEADEAEANRRRDARRGR